jgi:hypothetical protein
MTLLKHTGEKKGLGRHQKGGVFEIHVFLGYLNFVLFPGYVALVWLYN